MRSQLPDLRAIVQYIGEPAQKYEHVYSWNEFMQFGADVSDTGLLERHRHIAPNKCCTIIYTSGTTGNPKGTMLSHDNFIWTSKMVMKCAMETKDEVFISYLPLSHVAAQVRDNPHVLIDIVFIFQISLSNHKTHSIFTCISQNSI